MIVVKERTPRSGKVMIRLGVAPLDDDDAPVTELDGVDPLELETDEELDKVAIADDETKVDVVNPEDAGVAEMILMEGNEVSTDPTVIVDSTPVSVDALESVSVEGIGIVDVADASGEENEPDILLRLKKDE